MEIGSRGINKLLFGTAMYVGTSFILAPEIINPYYTTYVLDHRFPDFKYRVYNLSTVKEQMEGHVKSGYNCAYESIVDMASGSSEPETVEQVPQTVEVPAENTTQKAE